MVRPNEIVEALLYSLKQSDAIPDEANYIGYEPDINSESIKLPLVQITMLDKIDANEINSEFVGFRTDDDGNQIGRIYETLYNQQYDVSVWTAHDSQYSARGLGDAVRDSLYEHTTGGPNEPLIYPDDGSEITDVWRMNLIDAQHTNDLSTSPTLRRWTETVRVSASERYITDAEEAPLSGANVNT
jgi:hypothetical protein